ncbi:hypothetical protein ScPMuIL_011564 [Solemya velum]
MQCGTQWNDAVADDRKYRSLLKSAIRISHRNSNSSRSEFRDERYLERGAAKKRGDCQISVCDENVTAHDARLGQKIDSRSSGRESANLASPIGVFITRPRGNSRQSTTIREDSSQQLAPIRETSSRQSIIVREDNVGQHTSAQEDSSRQSTPILGTNSRQSTIVRKDNVGQHTSTQESSRLQSTQTQEGSSRQPTPVREFSFSDYDIMADVDQSEDEDLSERDAERNLYTKLYKEACRSLSILPSSYLLKHLMDSELSMESHGLGVKGVWAVSSVLLENTMVRSVNLKDNMLGPAGTRHIANLVRGNSFITTLNISNNMIGKEGIEALATALSQNRMVAKLDISGNRLGDTETNKSLIKLNVGHNAIGEAGGCALGPAIANNKNIEVLDLSWNHLRGKGALAVSLALKTNTALRKLNVSWNGFACPGCIGLVPALTANKTLKELNLSSNRLEKNAITMLFRGVQNNSSLSSLKIGSNPITMDVGLFLLEAVNKSKSSALRYLDIKDTPVDGQFIALLREICKHRFLHVSHGPVMRTNQLTEPEDDGLDISADPVIVLFKFMNESGYRVIDLMKRFDRDSSMSVDRKEFKQGLMSVQVPLTEGQLDELLDFLDRDGDGEVDFKELIDGEKKYRKRMRALGLRDGGANRRRSSIFKVDDSPRRNSLLTTGDNTLDKFLLASDTQSRVETGNRRRQSINPQKQKKPATLVE